MLFALWQVSVPCINLILPVELAMVVENTMANAQLRSLLEIGRNFHLGRRSAT
jgi:hypothetical protein